MHNLNLLLLGAIQLKEKKKKNVDFSFFFSIEYGSQHKVGMAWKAARCQ